MRSLVTVLCVVGFGVRVGQAQEPIPVPPKAESALLGKGELQEVNKPLEQIFRFALDGARLKLDRAHWEKAAGSAPKPADRIAMLGFGGGPPVETLFNQIVSASGPSGRGMSSNGKRRVVDFSGEKLVGRLHTSTDLIRMSLEESQAPHRALELNDDGQGALRIQLSNADGDMVMLTQARGGRFTVVAIASDQVFTAQGESFLACFRQHRRGWEASVLPVLEQLGIRPLLSPSTPPVRRAVLSLLARTPEVLADGKRLLADLDSDKFAIREKANQVLTERFEIYQDLIRQRLQEKLPLELQRRLEKIVEENTDAPRVGQVVAALGLLEDAGYLVSLLDQAGSEDAARVVGQLEKVTGQKLGSDAAAWKEWVKQNGK